MRKVAEEWDSIVTSGRIRRKHQTQKEQEDLREIEKQERLEWERYQREIGL
ncbi:MAG: hypothetical protein GF334_13505 [Candidatus Altiarchaeales archaeon]|nr:hypothetical protein [Candidatus Altiarchaeales archaeon]